MKLSGIPSIISTYIRNVPYRYQGLDHQSMFITQGIQHVEILQKYGAKKSVTRWILLMSIESQKN